MGTTIIFQANVDDGCVVGILPLKVVITKEDGYWFAQGLDIDYFAQGSSLEEVQKNFEKGMKATIEEHIKIFGTIEKFLKPAPDEVWTEFYHIKKDTDGAGKYAYAHISTHTITQESPILPYDSIKYISPQELKKELQPA